MTSWEEYVAAHLQASVEGLPANDHAAGPWAAANVAANQDLRVLTAQVIDRRFVDALYEQLAHDLHRSVEVALPLLDLSGEPAGDAVREMSAPLRAHAQGLADRYEEGEQALLSELEWATARYIERIESISATTPAVAVADSHQGDEALDRLKRIQSLMARFESAVAEMMVNRGRMLFALQKRELHLARSWIIADLHETDLAYLDDLNGRYRAIGALLTHGPAFGGFAMDAVLGSFGIGGVLSGPLGLIVGMLNDVYVQPRREERHYREVRTVVGVFGILFGCGVFPAMAIQTARMQTIANLLRAQKPN